MDNIDKGLQIGIQTLFIVRSQAEIISISQDNTEVLYILEEIKIELNNGIKQIDELIGEKNYE